jgi:hypothetical protein
MAMLVSQQWVSLVLTFPDVIEPSKLITYTLYISYSPYNATMYLSLWFLNYTAMAIACD